MPKQQLILKIFLSCVVIAGLAGLGIMFMFDSHHSVTAQIPVPTPTNPSPTPTPPPTPAAPTATDILNQAVKAMQKQQGYTYSTTFKTTFMPDTTGTGWATWTGTGSYKTLVSPYALDGSDQVTINSSSGSPFNGQPVGVATIYTNGTLYTASESEWQPMASNAPYAQLRYNDPLYLLASLQTLHPYRLHLSQAGGSYVIQINLDASTSNITLMKKYESLILNNPSNFAVEHFNQTVWIDASTMLVTKVDRDYKFSYQINGQPGSKEENFSLTVDGPFNGTVTAPTVPSP